MKKYDFKFPILIIILSMLLGYYMNYRSGMNMEMNLENMLGPEKLLTYSVLFVVIFLWRNRNLLKKN